MNAVLIAILVYIILQLGFAFWVSRRVHNEEDYLVAGRRLGPWLATFTIFATWFGAETCIGAAGQAYEGGLSSTKADPFGYGLGIILFGLLIAVPLWKSRALTLADVYRNRFGIGVERLAAIIMIPTSLLWAAAQIRAFGQVLAASSEMGVVVAITLAAVVVIAYTTVGGLWADAFSDLLQGGVLIVGVLILGVIFFTVSDGLTLLAGQPGERLSLTRGDPNWLATLEALAVPIFGSLVAQELASRVLATRSPQLARRAAVGAGFLYLAVGLIPVSLGLVGLQLVGELDEPEQVLMVYAQQQLPTFLYIVMIGALVSAILSTVDSALLVSGALTAHNLVLPVRPDLSEKAKLRINRGTVMAYGVIAYVMALFGGSVYELVIEASSLGTAGLLVILGFSLWGKRYGGAACAYAALVTGFTVYVTTTHLFEIDYPYVTSVSSALFAYLALLPWSKPVST
jgi:Na+/proline symporter